MITQSVNLMGGSLLHMKHSKIQEHSARKDVIQTVSISFYSPYTVLKQLRLSGKKQNIPVLSGYVPEIQ